MTMPSASAVLAATSSGEALATKAAGLPAHFSPAGMRPPAGTTAPGSKMELACTTAPSSTAAPAPMETLCSTTQERSVAPAPMDTPSPILTAAGKPESSDSTVCTTARACTLEPAPMETALRSPRMTAPYQTLASSRSSTWPTTEAFGATNASFATTGRSEPSLHTGRWRETAGAAEKRRAKARRIVFMLCGVAGCGGSWRAATARALLSALPARY
mmetsp:Transcript_13930/g.41491  ORF Transcript_13930/g.41491 Transcript_13930/m.41491 type:complete len:216 (+) Transcript_13930:94-741(+)